MKRKRAQTVPLKVSRDQGEREKREKPEAMGDGFYRFSVQTRVKREKERRPSGTRSLSHRVLRKGKGAFAPTAQLQSFSL